MTARLLTLPPGDPLHEQVLDDTFPLWHDDLRRGDYGRYNYAQLRTAWGGRHLSRVALVDEHDTLLASAKRYDMRVRLDGRSHRVLGIGAVFTPPALRGRGHAKVLIAELEAAARRDGASLAMLFSEIRPEYYQALGYTALPLTEASITVRLKAGAPAVLLRSAEERDLPWLAEMHHARTAAYRFSLEYQPDWLQYSVTKKRLLSGFGRPGTRDVEFFVVEEGTRAVAWLLLQAARASRSGSESWSIASCGDRDPDGARIGAALQALIARTPDHRPPVIRAWWPTRLQPPQLGLHLRPATGMVLMVKLLGADGAVTRALEPDDLLFWHGDAF